MKHPHSDIHLHAATSCASVLWRCLLACIFAAAISCTTSHSQLVPDKGFTSQFGGQHALLGQVYRGTERVTREVLFSALRHARYVVLGETHDNRDHHALQAQLVQQYLTAQPGAAVAFEMLDEDDASALSAATPSELEQRVDWANSGWPDFALYRPVFDAAFSAHARIVAAHPSAAHVRASMQGVAEAEARELHIDAPLPESLIKAQHDEIRESHCGHAPDAMLTAMQRAQVYKDAFMARAIAQTGAPTVLIAGRGHARNDRAVPYFLDRAAAGATVSIAFIEVDDSREDPKTYDTQAFDYAIFTPRASNEDPCEKFRKQLEQMRQHPGGA